MTFLPLVVALETACAFSREKLFVQKDDLFLSVVAFLMLPFLNATRGS